DATCAYPGSARLCLTSSRNVARDSPRRRRHRRTHRPTRTRSASSRDWAVAGWFCFGPVAATSSRYCAQLHSFRIGVIGLPVFRTPSGRSTNSVVAPTLVLGPASQTVSHPAGVISPIHRGCHGTKPADECSHGARTYQPTVTVSDAELDRAESLGGGRT